MDRVGPRSEKRGAWTKSSKGTEGAKRKDNGLKREPQNPQRESHLRQQKGVVEMGTTKEHPLRLGSACPVLKKG